MKTTALSGASAIALLIGMSVTPTAFAQQTVQAAPQAEEREQPDSRRDVVVVTAQKREETVQDIAIAVTAVNSEMRQEIGLNTLQDFTNFSPGLTFSVANDRIGMRGINRNTNNFGIRSGVSNYVDGVYYPSSIIATASRRAIMVDRTEVVRGPQGTLYGRDSIGGALNLISKRPTDEFSGELYLGIGTFDTRTVDLSVSGPITDWLRYRVVGSRDYQGEGFLNNAAGGETEGLRTNGYNYEVQFEGDIGDSLSWFARWGHIQWVKNGAPGARTAAGDQQPYDTRLFNVGGSSLSPGAGYGYNAPSYTQIGSFIGNPAIDDPFTFNADFTSFAKLEGANDAALEVIWEGPGVDVKYVGGYGYYNYLLSTDTDNTPVNSFQARVYPFTPAGTLTTIRPGRHSDYTEQRAWFSNEINVLSTYDGPFQFIAGLYQYQENFGQPVYVLYDNPQPGASVTRVNVNPATGAVTGISAGQPVPTYQGLNIGSLTDNNGIANSYGVFTQVDYTFNDQWKWTGGLRYSADYSYITERGRVTCYYTNTCQSAGATVANPGVDATDQAFYGALPTLYPNGAPGVVGASAANPSGTYTDEYGNRARELYGTWSAITGMLRLDWTPTPETLVYANYARGYKGGGFNATSFAPTPRVDKETIDSYEIGWKQDFPDLYLTVNSDLFFYDYKGYQVPNAVAPPTGSAVAPYTSFLNLPKVETTGFEVEATWAPLEELRILANYGYVHPEIKDASGLIDSSDPLARAAGAVASGAVIGGRYSAAGALIDGQVPQDLAGNVLPLTPENKVSISALYTFDWGDMGSLTASTSYTWQDQMYATIFNRDSNKSPEWSMVNARLIWNSPDSRFRVIGFVNNIFDSVQYDNHTTGLRRADSTAAATAPGGALTSTARFIPQQLAYCGTTAATSINPAGNNGYGSLAESCLTDQESYRMPRWGGIEFQVRF